MHLGLTQILHLGKNWILKIDQYEKLSINSMNLTKLINLKLCL
jgi:hypothetical protein